MFKYWLLIALICVLESRIYSQVVNPLGELLTTNTGQHKSTKNKLAKSIIDNDSDKSTDNQVKILPSLQIVLNVHPYNKLNELPFVLSGIEAQNYPKDRINILIQSEIYYANDRTDEHIKYNDRTIRMLKSWKRDVELYYHKLDLKLVELDGLDKDEVNYWSANRYKKLMNYKSFGFEYALNEWADYCLFQDADVVLTNSNTYLLLITNQTKTIISPMLLSLGMYSNFWAGVDETGYYKRTDDYVPILHRLKIGKFKVPMIHSFVLIDLRTKKARSLKFRFQDLEQIEKYRDQLDKTPFDDMIVFAKSAQSLNISFYIDNNEIYGFIMPSIDQIDLTEQHENLLALNLECLIETDERFKLATNLQQYLYPSKKTYLIEESIDKIYVINLKRRVERREYMQSVCDLMELKCEFVQAIDGKLIDKQYLMKNKIQVMQNYLDPFHKRPMTYGEIGCFMSHYNIWLNIVKHHFRWAVILEDDVRFEKRFHSRFNNMFRSIRNSSHEIDLVYLGRKREGKPEDETWFNEFTVRPTYSYWTIGYLISLNGARKLIESRPLDKMIPVDEFLPIMYNKHPRTDWSNRFPDRNLSTLSVHPMLIQPLHYVGDDLYISDTEDSNKLTSHEEL